MREREKRRHSIIVKGLKAKNTAELAEKFHYMSGQVMGVEVSLSEVTAISNHANMYRAKVLNDEHRKLVLENSKKLKDTSFCDVYITRDLTYAQRSELFQRRKARKAELGKGDQHPHPDTADAGGAVAPTNSGVPTPTPSTQGN